MKLGSVEITLWSIIYFFITIILLIYITGKLRRWLIYKVLNRTKIDLGVRIAVSTIIRYIILFIGFLIILQSAGIDLSSITIIAGALGVGIGFGLQNITNNFVSGIVILVERPIKVGDRIEVGEVSGDVVRISMRATTIITNDNISIIVPNSEFISNKVINWSHSNKNLRLNFPIYISYTEDPEKIKSYILDVVSENEGVLKDPKPDVLFDKFGENGIVLRLRVWTREYINRPGVLRSQIYYAIFAKFKEKGIEIPYPRRDITIRENPKAMDSDK
ncbi:MAG TPA: mechanosensitive ion channel domain-containing protein [Ignavibacteriaceae bacterium]|nr:mechanosensitive ion channel domain-containing protein [Ignavibacteriaceae bacterium]